MSRTKDERQWLDLLQFLGPEMSLKLGHVEKHGKVWRWTQYTQKEHERMDMRFDLQVFYLKIHI